MRAGWGVSELHCASCGKPQSNHPYRHPFVAVGPPGAAEPPTIGHVTPLPPWSPHHGIAEVSINKAGYVQFDLCCSASTVEELRSHILAAFDRAVAKARGQL